MNGVKLSMAEAVNGNYRLQLDGYYKKSWENYEMPNYHKHNRIEMMFVDEGECDVWVLNEGDKQDNYTKLMLSKGEGVLIDAEVWHKLIINDKCRITNLEFLILPCSHSVNTLKEAVYLSSELKAFLPRFSNYVCFFDRSNVKAIIKALLKEMEIADDFPDHENVLTLYSNVLLMEIARSYRKMSGAMAYEIYVKKAIKYINTHIKEKIRSEDIANVAGVKYAHLERVFKSRMGITLGEYINKQKIEIAETMLLNTAIPVTSIASLLGFGSRQQFNNVFKRVVGVSPQKFRQNQMDNQADVWYGFTGDYAMEVMKSNKGKDRTDD